VPAAVFLGLFGMVALSAQAQAVELTGCTTSVQWVQQGSDYFQGKGNVICTAGTYRAKLVCHNMQTGEMYVKYGTQIVTAPNTASAICDTGNVAEQATGSSTASSTSPTGCLTWSEWVSTGYNSGYYGRGTAQCDTGRYRVQIACHNNQTGANYTVYGYGATAPNTDTTTCYSGNVAQTVTAVPA
jgi:hypothetical protein